MRSLVRLKCGRGLAMVLGLAVAGVANFATSSPTRDPILAVDASEREILALAVEEGRAEWTIPGGLSSDPYLVVVSCLARGGSSWPIQLRISKDPVNGTSAATPIETRLRPISRTQTTERRAAAREGRTELVPQRSFHVLVGAGNPADPRQYRLVEAELARSGPHVLVYVDKDDRYETNPILIQDLIETFERSVLPTSEQLFGTAEDIDGDGRFTILLTSWLGRLAGGGTDVDGLFRGADLIDSLAAPLSNHCDMIYLNAKLAPGAHSRSILAHEYTHAVTFSRRALSGRAHLLGNEEEGWLDEGIAHLVEDLHGFSRSNLDHRVRAFLEAPERYSLAVPDYCAAGLFRSDGHRGSTYLFLRWCLDRFGPELITALVESERSGVANLESSTGYDFRTLFRLWAVSLFLDQARPSGVGGPVVGPRPPVARRIDPNQPELSWTALPTTNHYAVVSGATDGTTRLVVSASPDADIEVSVVRLTRREQQYRPVSTRRSDTKVVAMCQVATRARLERPAFCRAD